MRAMSGTVFEAIIVPHRSLGVTGARWLAGGLIGLSGLISTMLFWLGAWPVVGFNGAEIALALVLLRRNARAACTSELLLLTSDALRIVRVDARGNRREQTLDPWWIRTMLEDRLGRTPVLWLSSRLQRYEVAASLGTAEKRDLATALRGALSRMRHPVFDNPQLRL